MKLAGLQLNSSQLQGARLEQLPIRGKDIADWHMKGDKYTRDISETTAAWTNHNLHTIKVIWDEQITSCVDAP